MLEKVFSLCTRSMCPPIYTQRMRMYSRYRRCISRTRSASDCELVVHGVIILLERYHSRLCNCAMLVASFMFRCSVHMMRLLSSIMSSKYLRCFCFFLFFRVVSAASHLGCIRVHKCVLTSHHTFNHKLVYVRRESHAVRHHTAHSPRSHTKEKQTKKTLAEKRSFASGFYSVEDQMKTGPSLLLYESEERKPNVKHLMTNEND